jgi:hypothetical protein
MYSALTIHWPPLICNLTTNYPWPGSGSFSMLNTHIKVGCYCWVRLRNVCLINDVIRSGALPLLLLEANGGKIVMAKFHIPTVGTLIFRRHRRHGHRRYAV